MTLNLTVVTPRCIYQCADYLVVEWGTGTPLPFTTQKIFFVNTFTWSATVCFAGVGRLEGVDVSEWLRDRVASVRAEDPLDKLLDELLKADDWLVRVPNKYKRHSFSIGAFVGSESVFSLVSNHEYTDRIPSPVASPRLHVTRLRPTSARTFVSGQYQTVGTTDRESLATLAEGDPDPVAMESALVELNEKVANRLPSLVSRACFTTHLRLTGEGGGRPHNLGVARSASPVAAPAEFEEAIKDLLEKEHGPGGSRLVQFSAVRSEASDEFHQTQLREKPNDPDVHNNYGVYLQDKKDDLAGAEGHYRRAIELKAMHANALGNLGNLLWRKGEIHNARELYEKAVSSPAVSDYVFLNYAGFLDAVDQDRTASHRVIDQGLASFPDSGRLHLLRARLQLADGTYDWALKSVEQARAHGAPQDEVESLNAIALQLSGTSTGEAIAAYRVAITLAPHDASLRLNLAQLLFLKGDRKEAQAQLSSSLSLDLDDNAMLEAQFYLLCYPQTTQQASTSTIKRLLESGVRLSWNVSPNIEGIRHQNPKRAQLLERACQAMRAQPSSDSLDEILRELVQP